MSFYKKDITPQIHRLIINLDQLKRKMKRKKSRRKVAAMTINKEVKRRTTKNMII